MRRSKRPPIFDREWRKTSAEWVGYMKSAAVTVAGWLEAAIKVGKEGFKEFKPVIVEAFGGVYQGAIEGAVLLKDKLSEGANAGKSLADRFREFEKSAKGAAAAIETITARPASETFVGGGGGLKFPGKGDDDAIRASMEAMRGALQLENIAFQSAQEQAASSLKLFGMTETQKTDFLL